MGMVTPWSHANESITAPRVPFVTILEPPLVRGCSSRDVQKALKLETKSLHWRVASVEDQVIVLTFAVWKLWSKNCSGGTSQ